MAGGNRQLQLEERLAARRAVRIRSDANDKHSLVQKTHGHKTRSPDLEIASPAGDFELVVAGDHLL